MRAPASAGYGMPRFASIPGRPPLPPAALVRLQRALQELHTAALGTYWDPQRWHVLNHYRGLEPGPEHFGWVAGLGWAARWRRDAMGMPGAEWERGRNPSMRAVGLLLLSLISCMAGCPVCAAMWHVRSRHNSL